MLLRKSLQKIFHNRREQIIIFWVYVGLLSDRLKNSIPLQYKGLILDLVTILPLDHFLNLDNWPAQSGVYNGEFFF